MPDYSDSALESPGSERCVCAGAHRPHSCNVIAQRDLGARRYVNSAAVGAVIWFSVMKKLPLAALVLLLAASATAQDAKPDFSGKWSLDIAKSDFGAAPPPESIVHVIEHKEPSLKVSSTQTGPQGTVTNTRNLTTDGKENANTMRAMGTEQAIKSTTKWDASKLVTALKVDFQGMTADILDSWELSADGKVLTISRQFKTTQGDFTQKTVFNK